MENDGFKEKDNGNPSTSDIHQAEQKNVNITPNSRRSFMMPGDIPASPPKFVSLEELMKAANGMTNMALAHEIAVNKDFTLEKLELPVNSIEKRVHDTMHKAFWDVLIYELNEDPPSYTQALVLLNDVRQGLLDLLLPQHTKIRQQISEILDIDLITQQANTGTLDFQQYAQYVISVMSKLCAPVRDEKIAELSKTTDVVEAFKGILETIDLMKIDMANFTISMIRPQIIASSVQYEKQKFADFLALQIDGLAVTREWLTRHLHAVGNETDMKKKVEDVLNDAYLELVDWKQEYTFPETLTMDESRILDLRNNFKKLTDVGAILLLTYSHMGPNLSTITELKITLKNNLLTLIDGAVNKRTLEQVCAKLDDDVRKFFHKYTPNVTDSHVSDVLENLKKQVLEVEDTEHRITTLLKQRIKEFLHVTITSRTAEPMKIPPGLSSLQQELAQLAGSFLRLISHNRAVFGEYYDKLIVHALEHPNNTTT